MSPTATDEIPQPRRARRGTGGRWKVFLGRGVLWTAIALIIVNAIMNQVRPYLPDSAAQAAEDIEPVEEGTDFPDEAAAAFAASFAEVYLQGPDEEDEDAALGAVLTDFIPEDEARTFTLPEDVSGDRVRIVQVRATDDHHGLVTLSARVQGEPMHLEVPVYADSAAALVVSGPPALLPAPAQATLPEQSTPEVDSQAAEEIEPLLEGFFAAWAETPEHLDRYVAPDADITPLPEEAFEFAALEALTVPPGAEGEDRQVQATVTWQLPGGSDVDTLTQRYEVTMTPQAGSWYVTHVQGAATTPSS